MESDMFLVVCLKIEVGRCTRSEGGECMRAVKDERRLAAKAAARAISDSSVAPTEEVKLLVGRAQNLPVPSACRYYISHFGSARAARQRR